MLFQSNKRYFSWGFSKSSECGDQIRKTEDCGLWKTPKLADVPPHQTETVISVRVTVKNRAT